MRHFTGQDYLYLCDLLNDPVNVEKLYKYRCTRRTFREGVSKDFSIKVQNGSVSGLTTKCCSVFYVENANEPVNKHH